MTAARLPAAALIGWQTLLADLSLILFMVTAAAMAGEPDHRPAAARPPGPVAGAPQRGEPLALWRAGGAQSLEQWLAGQQRDDRQQLTITARFRKGGAARAVASAQALVSQAGALGGNARVIIAPAARADGEELLASLAYDQAR